MHIFMNILYIKYNKYFFAYEKIISIISMIEHIIILNTFSLIFQFSCVHIYSLYIAKATIPELRPSDAREAY